MADINISITNKRPTVEGSPVIVCGNSDYQLRFSFDGEWSDTSAKTARFVYIQDGEVRYQDVAFTGATVAVPVLAGIKEVRVGVYAGNLQTSTPAVIPCEYSIRCGTAAPSDPTPSQYDQILDLLQRNNAAIAGIKVGGRNFIINTRRAVSLTGKGLDTTATSSSANDFQYASIEVGDSLSGNEVTVSFDLVNNITEGSCRLAFPFSWQPVANFSATENTAPTRYTITRTMKAAERTSPQALYLQGSFVGTVTLSNVKLELGNTPTGWSLAPEDILALEDRIAALEASLLAMGGET